MCTGLSGFYAGDNCVCFIFQNAALYPGNHYREDITDAKGTKSALLRRQSGKLCITCLLRIGILIYCKCCVGVGNVTKLVQPLLKYTQWKYLITNVFQDLLNGSNNYL